MLAHHPHPGLANNRRLACAHAVTLFSRRVAEGHNPLFLDVGGAPARMTRELFRNGFNPGHYYGLCPSILAGDASRAAAPPGIRIDTSTYEEHAWRGRSFQFFGDSLYYIAATTAGLERIAEELRRGSVVYATYHHFRAAVGTLKANDQVEATYAITSDGGSARLTMAVERDAIEYSHPYPDLIVVGYAPVRGGWLVTHVVNVYAHEYVLAQVVYTEVDPRTTADKRLVGTTFKCVGAAPVWSGVMRPGSLGLAAAIGAVGTWAAIKLECYKTAVIPAAVSVGACAAAYRGIATDHFLIDAETIAEYRSTISGFPAATSRDRSFYVRQAARIVLRRHRDATMYVRERIIAGLVDNETGGWLHRLRRFFSASEVQVGSVFTALRTALNEQGLSDETLMALAVTAVATPLVEEYVKYHWPFLGGYCVAWESALNGFLYGGVALNTATMHYSTLLAYRCGAPLYVGVLIHGVWNAAAVLGCKIPTLMLVRNTAPAPMQPGGLWGPNVFPPIFRGFSDVFRSNPPERIRLVEYGYTASTCCSFEFPHAAAEAYRKLEAYDPDVADDPEDDVIQAPREYSRAAIDYAAYENNCQFTYHSLKLALDICHRGALVAPLQYRNCQHNMAVALALRQLAHVHAARGATPQEIHAAYVAYNRFGFQLAAYRVPSPIDFPPFDAEEYLPEFIGSFSSRRAAQFLHAYRSAGCSQQSHVDAYCDKIERRVAHGEDQPILRLEVMVKANEHVQNKFDVLSDDFDGLPKVKPPRIIYCDTLDAILAQGPLARQSGAVLKAQCDGSHVWTVVLPPREPGLPDRVLHVRLLYASGMTASELADMMLEGWGVAEYTHYAYGDGDKFDFNHRHKVFEASNRHTFRANHVNGAHANVRVQRAMLNSISVGPAGEVKQMELTSKVNTGGGNRERTMQLVVPVTQFSGYTLTSTTNSRANLTASKLAAERALAPHVPDEGGELLIVANGDDVFKSASFPFPPDYWERANEFYNLLGFNYSGGVGAYGSVDGDFCGMRPWPRADGWQWAPELGRVLFKLGFAYDGEIQKHCAAGDVEATVERRLAEKLLAYSGAAAAVPGLSELVTCLLNTIAPGHLAGATAVADESDGHPDRHKLYVGALNEPYDGVTVDAAARFYDVPTSLIYDFIRECPRMAAERTIAHPYLDAVFERTGYGNPSRFGVLFSDAPGAAGALPIPIAN